MNILRSYVLIRSKWQFLLNELTGTGTATQNSRNLLRDKAAVGRQIRRWLSPWQRRRFDFTYREDFLSLFTFVKLN